jgi:signal transduction histidine kinase
MKIKRSNKVISSVFTKLLLIIIAAGLCINVMVMGFFIAHRKMAFQSFGQNMIQYVNYLISDLGDPPDFDRAREISQKTSLAIRYESPALNWSTSDEAHPRKISRYHIWHESPDFNVGSYRGNHFISVNRGDGLFTFELVRAMVKDDRILHVIVVLLGMLTMILGGAYVVIRWVLRPVKWLNEGVQQVADGNLNYQVPIKRSDELTDLAKAFNSMTARIRDMLHAKEQLLLDVSHELRSPLTRIKVALELIPESLTRKQLQEDILEMEKMVSEILEVARMKQSQRQLSLKEIDIAEFMRDLSSQFKDTSPGIEMENLPNGVTLLIDPEKVKTVFENVLWNAVKYSREDSFPIQVTLERISPYVMVTVKDDGIGIPEESLPFIFEPFYRVDKSRSKETGGYGLGLGLCKTIMEAHQGKIAVESEDQQGTKITLFFNENLTLEQLIISNEV